MPIAKRPCEASAKRLCLIPVCRPLRRLHPVRTAEQLEEVYHAGPTDVPPLQSRYIQASTGTLRFMLQHWYCY